MALSQGPENNAFMKKRGESGSGHKRAVVAFMKARDLKAADWSRRANVSSSALYNLLNDRSDTLHDATLKKLARAENVSVSQLTGDLDSSQSLTFPAIEVRGAVNAGVWREAAEWPPGDWERMYVPVAKPYKDAAFGLTVQGPSMNSVYPDGTILVCVSLYNYGRDLEAGDKVIVHRRSPEGTVEATVKEFQIDDTGHVWLWPRSNHPAHQQPIPMPNGKAFDDAALESDGDSIQISAIVLGSYRPEKKIPPALLD
ncbi:helix-turn-helix domain-containing protein [Pelagibius litoralis]|uniref:Helix-turn-helix domain-containing protein n=1 Tax=Pelagibius litoralis TaxID=374515 RepID=A0A967KIH7_9PROT|nr:S24 family peptidase [Pelagibius litoralis]NIA72301.1 helix-turn-helix domain-containing protein [Pelagibius litoralis]